MQRVGGQRRRVVLVELDQCPAEVGGSRMFGGVGVGLEFVLARQAAEQRAEREGEYWNDEEEQDQGQRRASGRHAKAGVEPRRVDQLAEQPENCLLYTSRCV